ncbi:MAG: hypothetical protein ACI9XZ_002582 [Alphaproteobacteria bacterium]|jgi:hypothetical protein
MGVEVGGRLPMTVYVTSAVQGDAGMTEHAFPIGDWA